MKNGYISIVFQSREQMVFRGGQFRRIGCVIKTLESLIWHFLLGCKCPVDQGTFVHEQDPRGELPVAFLIQNLFHLYQQRWVILRVESSALWKIIVEENALLIPKNRGRRKFSSGCLQLEFFGTRQGEPLCPISIDCFFISGSKWYNQVSSMVTICDRK